jgi:acid stress chaperone HdeB
VRHNFVVSRLVFVLALFSSWSAQGQVTIDASKITCDQFVHSKVANTRTVAAWLSGFYNGKQGNQVIDLQIFEANLSKLENFCYEEKNFKLPVMQAIERVIGKGK